MAKIVETKVITNKVRFSYVKVFEPETDDDGKKKYSVSLIIPKSDKETIKYIKQAIELAKENGKSTKFGGSIPVKNFYTPLRDGDEDRPEDEAYENAYFVNASSVTKPGLVDRNMEPITDEEELYSGCYGRASVTFYPFNVGGNKGIAAGLNHLQKTSDGDALGGRVSVDVDFDDEPDFDFEDDEDDFMD